jgi:hypothetical protein
MAVTLVSAKNSGEGSANFTESVRMRMKVSDSSEEIGLIEVRPKRIGVKGGILAAEARGMHAGEIVEIVSGKLKGRIALVDPRFKKRVDVNGRSFIIIPLHALRAFIELEDNEELRDPISADKFHGEDREWYHVN